MFNFKRIILTFLYLVLAFSMTNVNTLANPTEVSNSETIEGDVSVTASEGSVEVSTSEETEVTLDSPEDSETSTSTNEFSGLGLDDYEKVAKQIFLVKEAMSDEFAVGDGLTFTLYILRYLAEVGEYELTNKDIVQLVDAFEKISGEELDELVKDVIAGIKKIEFGKKDDTYFAKVFTINKDGIIIPINEKSDDGKIEEIRYAKIKNKAKLEFTDVVTKFQKSEIDRFLTEKVTIPLVSESWLPPLNQLHKDVGYDIENYLETTKIIPLKVKMKKIFIKVKTRTFLKNMDFYIRKVYTLAGRTKDDAPIPSFIMRMRAGLVNVKISIDQ